MKKCVALEGNSGYFNSIGKLGLCCNDTFQHIRDDQLILDYKIRQENLKKKAYTWNDIKFCDMCKQNEDQGFESTRQLLNKKEDVFELNINVGNICNLRCSMCRPEFSYLLSQDISELPKELSSWYKIKNIKKYNLTSSIKNNIEKFISTVDKPLEINVLGGEPLSDDETVDWFISLLEKFSNIQTFKIITNLTYKTKKTMFLAENYKVNINASIEGYEDSYEWGRFGAKWDIVLKNLLYFNKQIGERLRVHSVIHAISILGDTKLTNLLKENNISNSKLSLLHPDFLRLNVLTDAEKEILNLKNIEQHDPNLRTLFEQYMYSLEQSRKQSMPQSISTFFNINRDN